MGKRKIILCLLLILCFAPIFGFERAFADETEVYLGGMPAGFSLLTKGAHVVGIGDVVTENGNVSPAKDADLRVGDVILTIDGQEINDAIDIEKAIKGEEKVVVSLDRQGESIIKDVKTAIDLSGGYRIGVFVKDSVSGIGTITYIRGNRIASLGHPVLDDCGKILPIRSGYIYDCEITGVIKGERGVPGELRGVFSKNNNVAMIDSNLNNGVYGTINQNFCCENLKKIKLGTAKIGTAKIYTTIDGNEPMEYSISLVKTDYDRDNRNFVIKVTDKRLLEKTGGIVQGMSGSPIIQGGKIVGAVTHVFTNDPTRGFGITIDNMINR